MSSRTSIDPLSITNGKISKQAKIDPRKLAPAKEGQILIAGEDGRFKAGNLPDTNAVATTVTTEEEVLPPNQIKIGPNEASPSAKNQFVNVGAGEHSIPRRDSSGNLKAETADRATNADQATNATNADKLDSQEGTYYTNTSNHTAGSSAAISTSNGGIAGTSQTVPLTIITAAATGSNSNTTDYIVEHGLGNVPLDVKVFEGNEEVETEVVSTTTTSTIKFSKPDVTFTTKIFGLKS
tara:strand:- start:3325 stop:4038 length:714 start_codon:yes stop_codon:yes gene_type:complete